MSVDLFIALPVVAGVLTMLPWAYAYFLFPKAVARMLYGVDVGPFEPHMIRTARWVHMCGSSHLIMALRDVAMLAAMYLMVSGAYVAAVAILIVTLVPLIGWGWYSVWAISSLHHVSGDINQFIRAAKRAF